MENVKTIKEKIGKNEYVFSIYEKTFFVRRLSAKASYGWINEWWYDYKGDEELLKKMIDGFIAKVLARDMAKENRKKERLEQQRQMKKKAIDELNIWDLLHWSRWYDMTHNDFLQVCDKKGGKVFCRFIGSKVVDGDAWYYWEEEPIKDDFCDEGKWYVISPYGWIRISDCRRAWKSEWDRSYSFNYMD